MTEQWDNFESPEEKARREAATRSREELAKKEREREIEKRQRDIDQRRDKRG